MIDFKNLLGKKVKRLFLIIWPPWGEEKETDINMSFGFILKDEPDRLCVISVDKDELWSPHITYQSLPLKVYTWEDFYIRIKMWMEAEEDTELIMDYEYFEVSKCNLFEKIIDSEIIGIELLHIEGIPEPFGVKILFENEYIISTPNSDGNTVETKKFNKIESIMNFKHLGKVIYSKL